MSGSRNPSAGSGDADHDRTIRELRRGFLEGLPERVTALRRALRAISPSAVATDQPIGELWREAHNLAGTASSFGLPELAEPARRIEELAERWSDAGRVSGTDRTAALEHLDRLEESWRQLTDRDEEGEAG